MIDKVCEFLLKKIRKEIPDMDDEKAEVTLYGLQNIVGEVPKIFIVLLVALILGVLKETAMTFALLLPYRAVSGGFHLNTHLKCIISSIIIYIGIAVIAKYLILEKSIKYIICLITLVFSLVMIKLYAPADTEDVPILRKKDRKRNQILSYMFLIIGLTIAIITNINTLYNIFIFGYLVQSMCISKLAYRLTNNKYGWEVYKSTSY